MRKPCRNLKPTLKPTLNRPQYILKQPWTNPKEIMSLWWPTRHTAGQSPLAPSGAVEGDWLRHGGWFRLVSSNSPQRNLPSSHRWCWHQWELWTLGASRQNLQTAQASASNVSTSKRIATLLQLQTWLPGVPPGFTVQPPCQDPHCRGL